MSSEKFTKGPWRKQGNLIFGSMHGKKVAQIFTQHLPAEKSGHEEERANAALISTAPDMYLLLSEVASLIKRDAGGGQTYDSYVYASGIFTQIEKVLAKARGE